MVHRDLKETLALLASLEQPEARGRLVHLGQKATRVHLENLALREVQDPLVHLGRKAIQAQLGNLEPPAVRDPLDRLDRRVILALLVYRVLLDQAARLETQAHREIQEPLVKVERQVVRDQGIHKRLR